MIIITDGDERNEVIRQNDVHVSMFCRMSEYGIRSDDELVFFGQLYGMCDQVSFSLGKSSPKISDI